MKKTTLALLLAAVVCAFSFTGCQKEQPYSMYQIGSDFGDIILDETPENEQTEEQKDKIKVITYMKSWLYSNGYELLAALSNPLVFYSADEVENDKNATEIYNQKWVELQKVDWAVILEEGKAKPADQGGLNITTTGSISFSYSMTKGSAASLMPGCIHFVTVNY